MQLEKSIGMLGTANFFLVLHEIAGSVDRTKSCSSVSCHSSNTLMVSVKDHVIFIIKMMTASIAGKSFCSSIDSMFTHVKFQQDFA
jgi:hypothetical protein